MSNVLGYEHDIYILPSSGLLTLTELLLCQFIRGSKMLLYNYFLLSKQQLDNKNYAFERPKKGLHF